MILFFVNHLTSAGPLPFFFESFRGIRPSFVFSSQRSFRPYDPKNFKERALKIAYLLIAS